MSANDVVQVTNEFIQQNAEQAIKKQNKKGGPYSKNDQEARRDDVHRLHFESGYSARQIADLMNVNRNTINEDIRFLYSQISHEIGDYNLTSSILKQIHSLELQKNRLRKYLKKTKDLKEILAIEKVIFQIDAKLAQIIMKLRTKDQPSLIIPDIEIPLKAPVKVTVPENEIKEFVREMVLAEFPYDKTPYSEKDIIYELMRKKSCDEQHARNILNNMLELGLGVCKVREDFKQQGLGFNYVSTYDLGKFSDLRKYITPKERVDKMNEYFDSMKEDRDITKK